MCRHTVLAITIVLVVLDDNTFLVGHSEPPDTTQQFSGLAREHRTKDHLDLGIQDSVQLLW